jgi:hypothetical protein
MGSGRMSASWAGLSTHTQRKALLQEGQLDRSRVLCMCRILWTNLWMRCLDCVDAVDGRGRYRALRSEHAYHWGKRGST